MLRLQNAQMSKGLNSRTRKQNDVECGYRLMLARRALGYATIREFAEVMFSPDDEDELERRANLMYKWEVGDHQVPTAFVGQLKRQFSVSLDYIYLGDMSDLSSDFRAKLLSAERHAKQN